MSALTTILEIPLSNKLVFDVWQGLGAGRMVLALGVIP